jgi:hypothetical protein
MRLLVILFKSVVLVLFILILLIPATIIVAIEAKNENEK